MAPAPHLSPISPSKGQAHPSLSPSSAPPPPSPSRSLPPLPPSARFPSPPSLPPAAVAAGRPSLLPSPEVLDAGGRAPLLPSPEVAASSKGPSSSPSPSWASIVSKNSFDSGNSLKYFPPPSPQGRVLELFPPAEVIQQGDADWKNSLVGYFYEEPLNFFVVSHIARKIWAKFGLSQVAEMENDFFLFRFANDIQMQECLKQGPWTFAGRPLFLKQWTPDLVLSKESHKTFPLWVHLKGVPVHYWTPLGLSWIASAIGKPIQLDPVTAKRDRLKIAHICVEVSSSTVLPERIRVYCGSGSDASLGVDVEVEYPWKPGQKAPSRPSKPQSKLPHRANHSGRLPPSANAAKHSGAIDSLRNVKNTVTMAKAADPVLTLTPSEAIPTQIADIGPVRIDRFIPGANNLREDCPISNPVTPGVFDGSALASNSFAALISPEAETLISLSAGAEATMPCQSEEPAPDSILSDCAQLPPCDPPLVEVDNCCLQKLPSGEPPLSNEVQMVKITSSSIPSLPRSSRSARRVLAETDRVLDFKDVGTSLSNPTPKHTKGSKKKPPPLSTHG